MSEKETEWTRYNKNGLAPVLLMHSTQQLTTNGWKRAYAISVYILWNIDVYMDQCLILPTECPFPSENKNTSRVIDIQ